MVENIKLEDILEFCSKHNISWDEFFLMFILYLDKRRFEGKPIPTKAHPMAMIYQYVTNVEVIKRDSINRLIGKGFIRLTGKGTSADDIAITDKFIDEWMVTPNKFHDFWELYPKKTENFNDPRGPAIPLRSHYEESKAEYIKVVKSRAKHEKIMDIMSWAIANDQIRTGILNFIKGRQWEMLEEIKEEGLKDQHIMR